MVRNRIVLTFLASTALACADDATTPLGGERLTGYSVGAVADSTPSGAPVGTGVQHVGGTVKGVGTGNDTLATAPVLPNVAVKAYEHLGYSGNDVLIGDQVASLTTDANGFFGYIDMAPGRYVVTFTPPASSEFRSVYVTYESRGSTPGTTTASLWSIYLSRK